MPDTPRLHTTGEIATMLGLPLHAIRNVVRLRKVPTRAYRGTARLFDVVEIAEALKSLRTFEPHAQGWTRPADRERMAAHLKRNAERARKEADALPVVDAGNRLSAIDAEIETITSTLSDAQARYDAEIARLTEARDSAQAQRAAIVEDYEHRVALEEIARANEQGLAHYLEAKAQLDALQTDAPSEEE